MGGWLLFFLSPFFWPNVFTAPVAVDLASFATGLLAAAFMTSTTGLRSRYQDPKPLLFLFLLLAPTALMLAVGEARSPWHAWRACLYLSGAWMIFALARETAHRLLGSSAWASILALIANLYVMYAILQAFDLRFLAGDRLFGVWSENVAFFPGPLMQRNWEALFLAFSLVFLWSRALDRPAPENTPSLLWELASWIPVTGVFLTSSRSGILVLLLGAALLLVSSKERKLGGQVIGRSLLAGLLISTTIMFLAPDVSGENAVKRFETGDYKTRLLIWAMSLELFLEHPWLGIGLGNMPAYGMEGTIRALDAYPSLATAGSALHGGHAWAHNLFLQFLAEDGLLGGIAIALLCWFLWRQGKPWISGKKDMVDDVTLGMRNGWIAACLIIVHGMVSVSAMQPYFLVLLGLALASQMPAEAKNASLHD